jgi:cytoskeletal protein RodZ
MEDLNEMQTGLSKEQKIGLILLLIFAIFAIGLGVLQIRNTMYSKFALNNTIPENIKDKVNTVDALRFRDTDNDGINDFDEMYVYSTSAYLDDTDSDGIKDKQEIDRGLNPLCAEGSDCSVTPEALAASISVTTTASNAILNQTGSVGEAPADLAAAISDPAQVRKMLLDSGVSKAMLDKVSDADLMNMIAEIMNPKTK